MLVFLTSLERLGNKCDLKNLEKISPKHALSWDFLFAQFLTPFGFNYHVSALHPLRPLASTSFRLQGMRWKRIQGLLML